MKLFDIVLGKSAGDIVLGMSRDNARLLLGDYREFRNGNVEEMNSLDEFSFCNLGYDKNDKVNFICFHTLKDIDLKLKDRIISDMTPLELFAYINELDNTIKPEKGGAGFLSNTLGFAAYFEKTPVVLLSTEEESFCEKLESITIAVPGYWI